MKITTDQFHQIFPANKHAVEWVEALNAVLPRYGITSSIRLAVFLGQCGHESGGFTRLVENLNYSAERLLQVFPKYFTTAQSHQYARQPEAIANRVYANRMGNGNEDSGDGWRFRGHGLLQLTGKDNHQAFADSIKKPLAEATAYMLTHPGAVESACFYWAAHNLNAAADTVGIEDETRKINGGLNGLAERKQLTKTALQVLRGQ